MLHKHKPVSRETMNWISPKYSICQTLREIYHKTEDDEIKYKCRIAVSMAKAMSKKLNELNPNWKSAFWDENEFFKRLVSAYYTHRPDAGNPQQKIK
jgi:hypothetical protein